MYGARKPQPRKTNHAVAKGEAVYAGGTSPSAEPWDAHLVFEWTEGGETEAQTNSLPADIYVEAFGNGVAHFTYESFAEPV